MDNQNKSIEDMISAAETAFYEYVSNLDIRSIDELPREAFRQIIVAALKAADTCTNSSRAALISTASTALKSDTQ